MKGADYHTSELPVSDPRSCLKVVHFNNLKLYWRKQGKSTWGQEKDSEGCGTVAMDSRTDGEESDELPADLFSFPQNSMVVSSPEDTTSEAPIEETTLQVELKRPPLRKQLRKHKLDIRSGMAA